MVVPHDCVKLYAVECSSDEVSELEALDGRVAVDLMNLVRYEVGATTQGSGVRVFCFGRNANVEVTPWPMSHYLRITASTCAYIPRLNAACIRFRDGHAIDKPLLHELTHAFMYELSDSFPYPFAVEEGLARMMESWIHLVPNAEGDLSRDLDGREATERYLDDSQFVSIRDLLQFETRETDSEDEEKTDRSEGELTRISRASYWMFGYLTLLGRRDPIVRRILREIRAKGIYSPGAVYEWLLHMCGMTPEALERGFYLYCTEGRRP